MLTSITNRNGLIAMFSTRGASLQRLLVPDAHGFLTNVVLSPSDPLSPRSLNAYAGAIIGPMMGRVRNSRLVWNESTAILDSNDGVNHLHGGKYGFSELIWDLVMNRENEVAFEINIPDQFGGYPGYRTVRVTYLLSDKNELHIQINAKSDVPTWFNITSHIYWNLSGKSSESIESHTLQIHASRVFFNRLDHTIECSQEVNGTPFDFRQPNSLTFLKTDLNDVQLHQSKGLNHLFELDPVPNEHSQLLFTHPASGRSLSIRTTLPAIWVYSGGYLNESMILDDNRQAYSNLGLAIEPRLCPQLDSLSGEFTKFPQTTSFTSSIIYTLN